MASSKVPFDFNPGITSPLYFIRKGLYRSILRHKDAMAGKLMDFGSGRKPYKALLDKVTEYIGVDYDGEGHPHDNESIDVFYNGKVLPFADETFDSVFSSEVFEHLFNLEEMLPEIRRVMKKDARILITCPFVWNLHEVPADYARYTIFALTNLFEKNGFTVLQADKAGNFITTLTQMRVLYFYVHVLPKLKLINKIPYFSYAVIAFMNGWGRIKNRLLPGRDDWYQSNIILAQKK